MKPVRIVIIAKAPEAGIAKTRLIPALGAEGAAQLARKMLIRTIHTALSADMGAVECCVSPDHEQATWTSFKAEFDVHWSSQLEGDLGQRMADVASKVIKQGENVLLIGTDCPELDSEHLVQAATCLNSHQACMISVSDGGYCLLGLSCFDESIFNDIAWSTADVAEQTRDKVKKLGWKMTELACLHDIDEPDDLAFLPAELFDRQITQSA